MSHTYTSVLVHAVFSTKDRTPFIDPALETRLYPYLSGILRDHSAKLLIGNGARDHVHLLVELKASSSLAALMRQAKACSSKWIHENEAKPRGFEWQRGYGAFSVSRSNVPAVVRYIERQKEHHRKRTFEYEFVQLLRRHGIEPDERFLFS